MAIAMIGNALPDQGAAVPIARYVNFFRRHPQGTENTGIELPLGVETTEHTGESKAQIGNVFLRALPLIDAYQRSRLKLPGRLFKRFARTGIDQGLVFIQMSRGLIETDTPICYFLDQQVTSIPFYQCGNGDIGFPYLAHSLGF